MAEVTHARGVKLLLKVEMTAASGTYTAFCSINSQRGLTFSSDTNDQVIPDCADPDLPGWVAREKVSLSAAFEGSGMLNTPDIADFFTWFKDDATRSAKVVVDVPTASGGRVFTGDWHLTQFQITGDRGGKVEVSISCASDGEITIGNND